MPAYPGCIFGQGSGIILEVPEKWQRDSNTQGPVHREIRCQKYQPYKN